MGETQRDDVIDQMREIATLKELNGELLAACKLALPYVGIATHDQAMNAEGRKHAEDCVKQLQDAIAKAEGETNATEST